MRRPVDSASRRAGSATSPPPAISAERLRATWAERQGLGASRPDGVLDAVRRCGWIHTAGGGGPYVALRARLDAFTPVDLDAAVFRNRSLAEVPAVRGCTMLVPQEDVPLALRWARRSEGERFARLAKACRVSEGEIARLGEAALHLLESGPRTAEQLREGLAKGAARSLGEAGKRLGDPTTLSPALRRLQLEGHIERVSSTGRLDRADFLYRLAAREDTSPPLPKDEAGLLVELARRFFRWAGPATRKEFAWWAGVSGREGWAAADALRLERLGASDAGEDLWDLPRAPRPPRTGDPDAVRLLPFRDNYLGFRRGLSRFLDPDGARGHVLDWSNRPAPLGALESLHHHAILVGGKLRGIWEWDGEGRRIGWGSLAPLSPSTLGAIQAAVDCLEPFLASELGDLWFYALDGARKRAERLGFVRSLAPR